MTEKLDLKNFKDKYKNLADSDYALIEAILVLVEQLGVIARKL